MGWTKRQEVFHTTLPDERTEAMGECYCSSCISRYELEAIVEGKNKEIEGLKYAINAMANGGHTQ